MSIEWFRSWHGAPTDPKWRTVARRAGARPGDVAAVAWVLFDRASQADDRGSIDGYDAEVIADALGYEPDEIERIIAAMVDKGVIIGGRLAAWEKHQPKRERDQDDSSARVTAHRARKSHVTPCNASDDQETPRVEEIREEEEEEGNSLRSFPARATRNEPTMISPDWKPTDPQADPAEVKRFVAYNIAKGVRMADWDAAWVLWLDRKAEREPTPKAQSPPTPTTWLPAADPRWADAAGRYQRERGKPLRAFQSKHFPEIGAAVPTDWLEPRAH